MASAPACQQPGTRTRTTVYTAGEPGGPCHVVADTPTGTLCGIELPAARYRNGVHSLYSCPRNGGKRCVLCADCERLLAGHG